MCSRSYPAGIPVWPWESCRGCGGRCRKPAAIRCGPLPPIVSVHRISAIAISVSAHAVSEGARKKIEGASGTVTILPTRPASRPRGVKKQRPAGDAEARGES